MAAGVAVWLLLAGPAGQAAQACHRRCTLQGRLVVDYSGLQALTLGVLQQVVRDVRELKAAAGSTQLSAMGGLQQLAARQLDAPGASRSSRALSASSSLTSLGSLAVLADDGDVEMSGSSEEEAADQAAAAEGEFAGLGDEAVVQLLMERLQEHEAHVRKLLGVSAMGPQQA